MKFDRRQQTAIYAIISCFGLASLAELSDRREAKETTLTAERCMEIAAQIRTGRRQFHPDMVEMARCVKMGEMTDAAIDMLVSSKVLPLLRAA